MKEGMTYVKHWRVKMHLDNSYNKQHDEDMIYSPYFVKEKTKT